jgi:pilus assembly protein CpaD
MRPFDNGLMPYREQVRSGRAFAAALLACSLLATAGCAKRDSITVGAVPDDYRTNHPIVITEKDVVIDLPVGAFDRGMTRMQRVALDGFLDSYDRSAGAVIMISAPVGAANDAAAAAAARDFRKFISSRGIPSSRIALATYQSPSPEASPPIRVSYRAVRAQTNKCGRWPDDVLNTYENKHYANFGCSYQNNLAAQIANPADLLGPRKQTEIDAANRDKVIGVYQDRGIPAEFLGTSEVNYD